MIQVPENVLNGNCDDSVGFALECDNNDGNIQSIDMGNISIVNEMYNGENECIPIISEMDSSNSRDGLELVNYEVELMAQNQINFHDEEILSTEIQSQDYIGMDGIYDVADINNWTTDGHEFLNLCQNDVFIDEIDCGNSLTAQNGNAMKSIKGSSKISKKIENVTDNEDGFDEICQHLSAVELRMYSNWIDSVIEKINLTMDFNDDGHPEAILFSVPHVSFACIK